MGTLENMSFIPQSLKADATFQKCYRELVDAFYGLMVDAGNTVTQGLPINDSIEKTIFKSLAAGICKESFNEAYIRYLQTGGNDEGKNTSDK